MSNESTQEELETIDTQHDVVMGEALKRLRNNPDFQTVIENGYLKEKVLASVSMLAVPQVSDHGKRPGVIEDIISASNLDYFLIMIEQFYAAAIEPVLSDEEEAEIESENGAE